MRRTAVNSVQHRLPFRRLGYSGGGARLRQRVTTAREPVSFVGFAGRCKPKDDLRKDSRMMDFATMLNRLFKKDIECRRRNL